jgi:hypothetical protein
MYILVARIAYEILLKENPDILDKVNKVLKVFSDEYPEQTPKEQDYPFIECVTIADDIKYHGGSW